MDRDPAPSTADDAASRGSLSRLVGNVAVAAGLVAGPLIVITGALADYFL